MPQMQDVLEPARPTVTTPASTQAAASRQPVDAPAGQGSGEQPTVVRMDPSRRAATVSSPDPLRVPSVEGGNQQAVQQQQQAGSAGRPAHSEQASSDGSHSSQAQHLDERMLLEHDRQSLGDSLEAGLDRQALSMPPQWQAPNQDWHAWQLRGVQRAQQAQGVLPLRQAVPRTSHHAACMECLRGQHAQACQHGMLGVQLDYVCNRCKARESKAHMSLPVRQPALPLQRGCSWCGCSVVLVWWAACPGLLSLHAGGCSCDVCGQCRGWGGEVPAWLRAVMLQCDCVSAGEVPCCCGAPGSGCCPCLCSGQLHSVCKHSSDSGNCSLPFLSAPTDPCLCLSLCKCVQVGSSCRPGLCSQETGPTSLDPGGL